MISVNSTIIRKKDIIVAELDQKAVMMSMENGKYYGLDEVASDIWNIIENKIKVLDLVSILTEKYSISKENCTNDVLDFLHELHRKNLIETV